MAWTTTDIEKLEKAIASGQLTVRYADRSITYQNSEAMLAVLKQMRAEVDAAAGTTPRRRTMRITQSGRGL
jgi:hypothetical protein